MNETVGLAAYAMPPAEIDEHAPTRSWDELTAAWIEVQEAGDQTQWTLGDIANEVIRSTGAKGAAATEVLDKFAADVKQKRDTVRQYRWVSNAFPKYENRESGLSWSHYRAAAKMANQGTQMLWIDEAVNNDWSVAQLQDQIKNVEDNASATDGRPCAYCGCPLPEDGTAYNIRQSGKVVATLCSDRCGMNWFYERVKNAAEQLAPEGAPEAVAA
jgi:hypothetical protein